MGGALWNSLQPARQDSRNKGLGKQDSRSGGLVRQDSRAQGLVKQESRNRGLVKKESMNRGLEKQDSRIRGLVKQDSRSGGLRQHNLRDEEQRYYQTVFPQFVFHIFSDNCCSVHGDDGHHHEPVEQGKGGSLWQSLQTKTLPRQNSRWT